MKKISALLLITVILMCLFCIPVEATSTSVNVSATPSVNAENNISVTISWAEIAGTGLFTLNYNSSVFEYVSGSASCQGGYAQARNLGSSLKIGAFGTSFTSVTMQFKAKSGTEGKTGSFNITSASLTDTSDAKMSTAIGTSVVVKVNEKQQDTNPTTPPVTEPTTPPITNPTTPPATEPITPPATEPIINPSTTTSSTKKTSTATGTKKATTKVDTSSNNNVNTANTNTVSNEVNNKTTNETKKTNTVTSKNKKSNNNKVSEENVIDDNNKQEEKKTNIVVPILVGVIIVMAIVLVIIRIRTME